MTSSRPLSRSAAGAIVAILAAVVLAADQFVKYLTVEHLPLQQVVPVLGDFFQLYYVRNPGAAFSLGSGVTWIFTIALAVVAAAIIWKTSSVRSRLWAIVLGALLGGVLGNLTDRIFREPGFPVGHVVDMLSLPWMMPAIFNVADIFIVCGMISVALLIVVGLNLDGTRETREAAGDASDAPAGDDESPAVNEVQDDAAASEAPRDPAGA